MQLRTLALLVIASAGCVQSISSIATSPSSGPLQALEDSVLFQPKTDAQSWHSLPRTAKVQDVWLEATLPSGEVLRVHAWWFPQDGSKEAVLFCHGNAGNLSHWTPRMRELQQALNQNVLIFDYPGYGKSGGKPSEEGCHAAAEAAYGWLRKTAKIESGKMIVCGESLGGGVATHLAWTLRNHARPRALVLLRTFTSVPDMARSRLLTSSAAWLVRNKFDNLSTIQNWTKLDPNRIATTLPAPQPPIFIAHGDRDNLIPFAQGKQLYEAASEPKRFFVMENCAHNDPWPVDLLPALDRFLREVETSR